MKITGAIFDFDGTLFDSMFIWRNAGAGYLEHIGLKDKDDPSPLFVDLTLREAAKLMREKYGLSTTNEEIVRDVYRYIKMRYLAEAKPKNDILPFLDKLKAAGIPLCIATATDKDPVSAALEKYGMLGYFGEIFTADSVGSGKTKPKIFRDALAFLGTEKETTWVFEDALYAARTAKADGFHVVGIYDESEPGKDELASLADVYIHEYRELDSYFDSL